MRPSQLSCIETRVESIFVLQYPVRSRIRCWYGIIRHDILWLWFSSYGALVLWFWDQLVLVVQFFNLLLFSCSCRSCGSLVFWFCNSSCFLVLIVFLRSLVLCLCGPCGSLVLVVLCLLWFLWFSGFLFFVFPLFSRWKTWFASFKKYKMASTWELKFDNYVIPGETQFGWNDRNSLRLLEDAPSGDITFHLS